MVAALAALILEAYPAIHTGDAQQVEFVRQILHGSSIDLGMPSEIHGHGLPMATYALQTPMSSMGSPADHHAVAGVLRVA
jgi:hypothetical protein